MPDFGQTDTSKMPAMVDKSAASQRLSQEANDHRSYLQQAIGDVASVCTSNTKIQSEVSYYGANFLKTAALFMPGKVGLAGTVVLSAIDQASAGSDAKGQVIDLVLGGIKGAGMRGVMHMMGSERLPEFLSSPAAKGVAFGFANRSLDTALNRGSYFDNNSNFSTTTLGGNFVNNVLNPKALISDAATFTIAHGLFTGVSRLNPALFERSPVARTVATSATFGISGGATNEIERQQNAHEKFDITKVMGRALLQGTIDAAAGVPGGMRMQTLTSRKAESAVSASSSFDANHPTHIESPLATTSALTRAETNHATPQTDKAQLAPIETYDLLAMRSRFPQVQQQQSGEMSEVPLKHGQVVPTLEGPTIVSNDGSHYELTSDSKKVNRLVQVDHHTDQKAPEKSPEVSEARAGLIKDLTITQRSMEAEPHRITGFKTTTEKLIERNSTPGPFQNYDDYNQRGISNVPTEIRKYRISGHDVDVIVRDQFGAKLDLAASGDHGSEDLSKRVTPADIPPLLDAMPDSRYFKRIFISDKPNPEDDWVTQTYYPSGFVSAMAMTDGELNMYKTERTAYLRRDVLHEWGHELRYKFWEDNLTWRFADAVNLEMVEWDPSKYAGRNNGEQWAVLGERMIGNDAQSFLEAADKAPIRTTIWMQALRKCLENVPEQHKSIEHDMYMKRVQYVEQNVLPKAIAKLERMQVDGKTEFLRNQATTLLTYLRGDGGATASNERP